MAASTLMTQEILKRVLPRRVMAFSAFTVVICGVPYTSPSRTFTPVWESESPYSD